MMSIQTMGAWKGQRRWIGLPELEVCDESDENDSCTHRLRWRGSPCDAWANHLPRTGASVTLSTRFAMMLQADKKIVLCVANHGT